MGDTEKCQLKRCWQLTAAEGERAHLRMQPVDGPTPMHLLATLHGLEF